MKVAIQMDPIGAIDIRADSTFRLAEEALRGVRGRQASEIFRRLEQYRAGRALFLET